MSISGQSRFGKLKEETFNKKVMCILHFFNYLKVKGHIERIPFDARLLHKENI